MSNDQVVHASEAESRALAEESRETWQGRSFLREIFLGELHVDWIAPFEEPEETERFQGFMGRLQALLEQVDSAAIEEAGHYPPDLLDELRALGCFGLKIDPAYGGLGFDQVEYGKICELVASYDGNLAALLSAHNSIGVPQPVKLFGTDEQKERYLTRCAAGAITAFALTEPDVGSDPARLATTATPTGDGHVSITGQKLWITNAHIAEMMVVMARDADSKRISAYIVEMDQEGVTLGHHCRFMGLKALANGVVELEDVRVPVANRIGAAGEGLKIALVTLNTGRLSLPAACVGSSRRCVEWARDFAAERVQWGAPVGQHEAVAHMLADITATTYAMESWSRLASALSMRDGYDIRLEAAAAKEWASTRGWQVTDDALQVRGGRGYENERSLAARGEKPYPIERVMRDSRINRIFEGSSEIMHLFMARELVDTHLSVSGKMLEKDATFNERLGALPGILGFYARWYPKQWWGLSTTFRYGGYGRLGDHLRYAERASRKLARNVFHGMVRYQARLEKKQAWLFRTVDIAMEIAVMTATIARAQSALDRREPQAPRAVELADLHAHNARRTIEAAFRDLWDNDDALKLSVGRSVVGGHHAWMETPSHPLVESTATAAGEMTDAEGTPARVLPPSDDEPEGTEGPEPEAAAPEEVEDDAPPARFDAADPAPLLQEEPQNDEAAPKDEDGKESAEG